MPLLLVFADLAVYANSFHGVFLFDDANAIVENPHLRKLWPPWYPLAAPPDASTVRRPVASLSLAINYALGGLDVVGFHLFNLAVHALVTLLLFGLISRTLALPAFRGRFDRSARWLAAAIVLVWTVHPLLTDAIDYVAQRTELLWALFLLLTLECLVRSDASKRPARWHGAAVASCALGMGSKEVMIVAPLLVLLYDRSFLAGSFRQALSVRRSLYVGLAATWALLAGLMVLTPFEHLVGFGFASYTPFEHALTQSGVILHYLRLAFWPSPLVLDYDGWPIARSLGDALPAAAAMLALLALALWSLRRHPRAGFLGAWFFLILAPSSSILPTPTEIAAERRMYMPLVAVVALVVIGGHAAAERLARRGSDGARKSPTTGSPDGARPLRAALEGGVVLAVAAALGFATIHRNADYRDAIHMWRDVLAKRPDSPGARVSLGTLLAKRGEHDEAIRLYEEALRLRPNWSLVHANIGVSLREVGRGDEALGAFREAVRLKPDWNKGRDMLARTLAEKGETDEAISHFKEIVRRDPAANEARNSLGSLLASRGERAEAIVQFREAIERNPDVPEVHFNLGLALVGEGKVSEGIEEFREAARLHRGYAEAHHALALALVHEGRLDEALLHAQEAVKLKPADPTPRRTLGGLLERAGRLGEAIEHYRALVRLTPESAEALNNLAWALATNPDPTVRDGPEAVRLASAACQKTEHAIPSLIDTLAAAYAASGRFRDAVQTGERAIAAARAAGDEALAQEIAARVALYKESRAFTVASAAHDS